MGLYPETCEREQVSLLVYSPLAQGYLTGKYDHGARPAGARSTLFNRGQRYETPGAHGPVLVGSAAPLRSAQGAVRGAVVIFGLGVAGVFASFTLVAPLPLQIAVVFGIFGVSAVLPVLNSVTTELFPTNLRSDAFSWANNLLGRLAQVLSPMLLGLYANQYGWGKTIAATTICPILAVTLILWRLPETTGLELEQTARVD